MTNPTQNLSSKSSLLCRTVTITINLSLLRVSKLLSNYELEFTVIKAVFS